MSSMGASEDSKDKGLEVLALYLSDDELVDFSNYNTAGTHNPDDRDKFMALTNMHQHALYQLGLAIMGSEVEGEGALEIFTDMLAMTGEALRQLKQGQEEQQQPEVVVVETQPPQEEHVPEVGGGSPGTELGERVEFIE